MRLHQNRFAPGRIHRGVVVVVGKYDLERSENVHPSAWQSPQPVDRYTLAVIGAGPAGLVAAHGAAALGAKVALIERDLLGGDCLNVGCVPSKTIIRTSRLYCR